MRYMIIHMDRATIEPGLGAHAFGPFDSIRDAEAFDDQGRPDDTCVKVMVPIVGPAWLDILIARPEDRVVGISLPEDRDAKTH